MNQLENLVVIGSDKDIKDDAKKIADGVGIKLISFE